MAPKYTRGQKITIHPVRTDLYQPKYPEIEDILKPVFKSLDLVTLQTLNAKIAIEGQDASTVAKDYLEASDLL